VSALLPHNSPLIAYIDSRGHHAFAQRLALCSRCDLTCPGFDHCPVAVPVNVGESQVVHPPSEFYLDSAGFSRVRPVR